MQPAPPDLLADARDAAGRVADLAARICAVPAPTGEERARAEFVAARLDELGYAAEIDDLANVHARRGERGGPAVLVLAHIDTVFPAATPLDVRRDGDWLHGPGIGDNSTSVAAVLTALALLDASGVDSAADLVVVFDVGEEGLGNLRGAHAALDRYGPEVGATVVIDGRLGHITHAGVGSVRWRVTVRGPGGHSFVHFGRPSAIHGLARIVAALADLDVPTDPKTTFNVGTIAGGTSVNTVAAEASAVVDLRSVDAAALDRLAARAASLVETRAGEGLTAEIEVLGERPAGARDRDDPLVRLAATSVRRLGREPVFQASSTDANVPIARGVPAVCVGVYEGEEAHTLRERLFVPSLADGMEHLVDVLLTSADWVAAGRPGLAAPG